MRKQYQWIFVLILMVVFTGCNRPTKTTEVNGKESQSDVTIYYNGDILTMVGDTPEYAEIVAEREGKIIFVGSAEEANKEYPQAQKVDLSGKTLLPAFIDGHGHFYNVGMMAQLAVLLPPPDGPGADFDALVKTLKSWSASEQGKSFIEQSGWIIGNGYDDSQLAEKLHPTREVLDRVSLDTPIIIIHQSGHLGVVNSKALEILGFDKNTPNPQGGVLRRDKQGELTGVLEENALFGLLKTAAEGVDQEFSERCVELGQKEYARNGYLTAQDGRTSLGQLKSLKDAAEKELLFLDVVAYPDITQEFDETVMDKYYNRDHQFTNRFRIGGVKLTLDGSPQGKTAWLTQHYHVPPEGQGAEYKGYQTMSDDKADAYVRKAFENRWQIMCHSNGDAAIDQYLRALMLAEKEFGYNDHRSVLIHGQTLRKDQIPQLVDLGVLPSLFPMHTFYWGDWHADSVLGHPRADYISPCRDVLNAGLTLTSHHDAPVTFPNSMRVLDATVNRVTRSGVVLGPEQCLTPYEGLKTLTEWAAIQYFEEDHKGTLSPGKVADFVVLDKNPLKIDPKTIHSIAVEQSIKSGEVVYSKK